MAGQNSGPFVTYPNAKVLEKREGVSSTTRKAYWSVKIGWDGGSQAFFVGSADDFDKFPAKDERCNVRAGIDISEDRRGKDIRFTWFEVQPIPSAGSAPQDAARRTAA